MLSVIGQLVKVNFSRTPLPGYTEDRAASLLTVALTQAAMGLMQAP